jgi:tetratricopeptide (TPR) repeat protein
MFNSRKLLYTLVLTIFCTNLFAQNKNLIEAYKKYKSGSYNKALEEIKKIKPTPKLKATIHYWNGLCYNRMQEYDLSLIEFQKALKNNAKFNDIHYELGQAAYAANNLDMARIAFLKSYKAKFKPDSSLYYMGHISQILEEPKKARSYYLKLMKLKSADEKLKQVANFQLAESYLAIAEQKYGDNKEEVGEKIKKYVFPQLDQAYDLNKSSAIAKDIKRRKVELMNRYNLDPNKMKNGRTLPKKRYSLSFSHEVSYDSKASN